MTLPVFWGELPYYESWGAADIESHQDTANSLAARALACDIASTRCNMHDLMVISTSNSESRSGSNTNVVS